MNARQLEVFRTVMRCGTLTSAAKVLNVSQPALSQILLHTEDQIGFKLFRRVRGRLIPTPEAEQLYPEADRLFRDLDNLRRMAVDLKAGRTGVLRLVASAPPSLSIVPIALETFRKACPGVRVVSYVIPIEVATERLRRGEAEVCIAMSDMPVPLIDIQSVGRNEIICLMRRDDPLAAKEVITPADLDEASLITYRGETLQRMLIEGAFAKEGRTLTPAMEIDLSIVAVSFVGRGLGVALVDGLTPWSDFSRHVTTRPFRPVIPVPICLLTSSQRPPSHSQTVLIEHLKAAVAAV